MNLIPEQQYNGIFLEFDRWLTEKCFFKPENRKGIVQIGNFTGEFLKNFVELGFKSVNYVDEDQFRALADKSKIFPIMGDAILNYDTVFINTGGDGYDVISGGIPKNIAYVVIRYKKTNVMVGTVEQFMNWLGFYLVIEGAHADGVINDLIFKRK